MSLRGLRNYLIRNIPPRTYQSNRKIIQNGRCGKDIIAKAQEYLQSKNVSTGGLSYANFAANACNDLVNIGVLIISEPERYKYVTISFFLSMHLTFLLKPRSTEIRLFRQHKNRRSQRNSWSWSSISSSVDSLADVEFTCWNLSQLINAIIRC